jgi:hypothetical protein
MMGFIHTGFNVDLIKIPYSYGPDCLFATFQVSRLLVHVYQGRSRARNVTVLSCMILHATMQHRGLHVAV